jgi:hypothetical protein
MENANIFLDSGPENSERVVPHRASSRGTITARKSKSAKRMRAATRHYSCRYYMLSHEVEY